MMRNYDQSVQVNCNPNWHYYPGHCYKILIIGGSESGRTNPLLNLINNQQAHVENIYL